MVPLLPRLFTPPKPALLAGLVLFPKLCLALPILSGLLNLEMVFARSP